MSQVSANELEKKLAILVAGIPYTVLDVTFSTPTARGASTMVKAKLRNLLNNTVQDKTFKTSEKFDIADVELVPAAFLYASGTEYHFMDNATYEQFMLTEEKLGDQKLFLKENVEVKALKYNGTIVSIELPPVVGLMIKETDPAIKGASASGRSGKKAVLETGLTVLVPLYIENGTLVRVNTETREVSGRA